MRASPSDPGFTLLELLLVLVILGVLAIVALPRLDAGLSVADSSWRDQVVASLRQAHASAVASRRLACVSVATGTVTVAMATISAASNCAGAARPVAQSARAPATDSLSLIFRPDGTATLGDGSAIADSLSIGIAGQAPITLHAGSGHAE